MNLGQFPGPSRRETTHCSMGRYLPRHFPYTCTNSAPAHHDFDNATIYWSISTTLTGPGQVDNHAASPRSDRRHTGKLESQERMFLPSQDFVKAAVSRLLAFSLFMSQAWLAWQWILFSWKPLRDRPDSNVVAISHARQARRRVVYLLVYSGLVSLHR